MGSLEGITPDMARHIIDRMGTNGQPPERGARAVNIATDGFLSVLRDEYLLPMKASGRNSTFKLVQAPFGGGKTHFLHCLREMAWAEGFATSLVGLSPKECPFDRPVSIYREVTRRIELPVEELDMEPNQGLDRVLRQIAEQRVEDSSADEFIEWLETDLARANVESRSYLRGIVAFLRAVVMQDMDAEELIGDYLLGEAVSKTELSPHRLREPLTDEVAFRWLRSLMQCMAALGMPGVVLMFDEMDRNMSLSVNRRRAIGDNLRQMIDYCGQSLLPGVIWCYAVPPEFMDTIVPEYPALAQRLKGASRFSKDSPLNPVIDLDRLPMGPAELLSKIGERLLDLAELAYSHSFDRKVQLMNISGLAKRVGDLAFESGSRRTFVKAAVSLLETQRRVGDSKLSAEELRSLSGVGGEGAQEAMPGEIEF
jgi:hypothetical protein